MNQSNFWQSRRGFIAAMCATLIVPAFVPAAAASEASGETAKVAKAVEELRAAMVAGDGARLSALVSDQLSYGHSDAHLDTKKSFLESLAGKNAFKSMVLSNQTIELAGRNAIVRHTFDAENNLAEGKTSQSHISVLQVWTKERHVWRLLARQSVPLKT
jgi:hypothetical protein